MTLALASRDFLGLGIVEVAEELAFGLLVCDCFGVFADIGGLARNGVSIVEFEASTGLEIEVGGCEGAVESVVSGEAWCGNVD